MARSPSYGTPSLIWHGAPHGRHGSPSYGAPSLIWRALPHLAGGVRRQDRPRRVHGQHEDEPQPSDHHAAGGPSCDHHMSGHHVTTSCPATPHPKAPTPTPPTISLHTITR
eukprot:2600990-Prymnesium_polylepis.1